jgi:hypothetical protein
MPSSVRVLAVIYPAYTSLRVESVVASNPGASTAFRRDGHWHTAELIPCRTGSLVSGQG